jgi:HSP20 family protein
MMLMRFDPFRELDRPADQAVAGARTTRTLPMEALRRDDQFIVSIDVPGTDANLGPDNLSAATDRGVLTLTIPVSEASKPRKVQIGRSGEGQQLVQTGSAQRQSVQA